MKASAAQGRLFDDAGVPVRVYAPSSAPESGVRAAVKGCPGLLLDKRAREGIERRHGDCAHLDDAEEAWCEDEKTRHLQARCPPGCKAYAPHELVRISVGPTMHGARFGSG